jgi:hypothetical protein
MMKAPEYKSDADTAWMQQKQWFASLHSAESHTSEMQLENLESVLGELTSIYNSIAVQNDPK